MAPRVTLIVEIAFKAPENVDDFIDVFAPLHQYTNANESKTISYELFRKKDAESTILIVERYADDAALDDIHYSGEEFKKFFATLGALPYVASVTVTRGDAISNVDARLSVPRQHGDGVLVFCGARIGKDESHVEAAKILGAAIAKSGKPLVYGGGTVGVMGALSRTVADNQGAIHSVIPEALMPREVSGELIGQLHSTSTMNARKTKMFALSDTVVVLPGGIGTFDEVLDVLTLIQLNAYRPKLGFLNAGNFFGPFFDFVRHLISQGYLEEKIFNYFLVEDSIDGAKLLERLASFEVPPSIAQIKWN